MFSTPDHNIEQFKLREGTIVADLGAGSGFYTMSAARALDGSGKVYAVEVQKDLVSKIKNEAIRSHLNNVEVIWGDIEKVKGTRLADHTVDSAIISNTLFQLSNKESFIEELNRILKPSGKILVVDWTDSVGGLGPRSENVFSEEKSRPFFEKYNFTFEEKIDAGEHHYGMIFRKAKEL
ncbi:hypothetical protein COB64_02650 [Candidatus Wolfebacteria bacterium]|nr:MAG: hypothetical protein COB64_02650 [Candidatus Wolfebacteria bacterium]